MTQLLNKNVLKRPPINPIDTSKHLPPYHDPKAFCQYHHQPDHDTNKCYSLRSGIQDFIDNNIISVVGVNDKGNKSIAPPNQNLQIFTNPLPSHFTNVIEFENLAFSPNDLGLESNNVVNLVGKPISPKDLCITFDPSETIEAPNGPPYIIAKIKDKLSRGVLIHPMCMVKVITGEYLYTL